MELNNMLPEARRSFILEQLEESGSLRLSDLARQLGVSSVTLRRDVASLSSQGRVKRIHGGIALVSKEVLSPNAASVEDIASRRVRNIGADKPRVGMVVPALDYYWPDVIEGARQAADELGYRLILRESGYDDPVADEEQIIQLIDRDSVSGLIVTPNIDEEHPQEAFEFLSGHACPAVFVERRFDYLSVPLDVDSVVSDHALGAQLALQYLVGLGHRKVGLVIGRKGPTGPLVEDGWRRACDNQGIVASDSLYVALDRPSVTSQSDELDALVESCRRIGITALLIHSDPEANAVVQYLLQHDINVPNDISVIAYDDEVAGLFEPALSAVRPPRKSLGYEAVVLLHHRISSPEWPTRRLLLNPRLSIRESTAVPRTTEGIT